MTQAEWYAMKNKEEAERVRAAHDLRMEQRRGEMKTSPGSFNPWEKQAAEKYFADKFRDERAAADDDYRNRELQTREKVAEFGMQGQRDVGATAAGITAEATKHGADQTLKGIEAQAQRDRDIEKGRLEFERWRTGQTLGAQDAISRREWGELDEDGSYRPGGRGYVAKTQGEAQAAQAAQAQQMKLEQERIKAEAKIAAERMKGDARIKSAISGNALLAGRPEVAQQMVETMIAGGMDADQIAQVIGGAKGGAEELEQGATQKQKIKEEIEKRST